MLVSKLENDVTVVFEVVMEVKWKISAQTEKMESGL